MEITPTVVTKSCPAGIKFPSRPDTPRSNSPKKEEESKSNSLIRPVAFRPVSLRYSSTEALNRSPSIGNEGRFKRSPSIGMASKSNSLIRPVAFRPVSLRYSSTEALNRSPSIGNEDSSNGGGRRSLVSSPAMPPAFSHGRTRLERSDSLRDSYQGNPNHPNSNGGVPSSLRRPMFNSFNDIPSSCNNGIGHRLSKDPRRAPMVAEKPLPPQKPTPPQRYHSTSNLNMDSRTPTQPHPLREGELGRYDSLGNLDAYSRSPPKPPLLPFRQQPPEPVYSEVGPPHPTNASSQHYSSNSNDVQRSPAFNPHSTSLSPTSTDSPPASKDNMSLLETILQDREAEIAHLRSTMEHNEKVIFSIAPLSQRPDPVTNLGYSARVVVTSEERHEI
ncbi:unnamed protein product [Cyprideis torosa]|uniref:Uncharacterized protein n=1 Tax=Cyprideis torosa TaxID=163714 RepID=A0A7R8W336_9CRUS|nr:unnamed protein product [Cyprideis torosa]CAG0882620.1 unnamed protein product [Cyprideis torosa]